MSEYDGIETIVCKLDLTEFNRKNAERIKLRQIEEIMEEKVETTKKPTVKALTAENEALKQEIDILKQELNNKRAELTRYMKRRSNLKKED